MLVFSRQCSSHVSRGTRFGIVSTTLVVSLLPIFQPAPVPADDPGFAKSIGRIYVRPTYRIKPEGTDEEKTVYNAIIAIDPTMGDWKLVVEKRGRRSGSLPTAGRWSSPTSEDGIWKSESDGQFPLKIFDQDAMWNVTSGLVTGRQAPGRDQRRAISKKIPKRAYRLWQSNPGSSMPMAATRSSCPFPIRTPSPIGLPTANGLSLSSTRHRPTAEAINSIR